MRRSPGGRRQGRPQRSRGLRRDPSWHVRGFRGGGGPSLKSLRQVDPRRLAQGCESERSYACALRAISSRSETGNCAETIVTSEAFSVTTRRFG